MGFLSYIPMCDAFVCLMAPLVEAVVHDLATGKIVYKSGVLSRREVGDDSLIDIGAADFADELGQLVYEKINFDGRLIKSISVPLKDNEKIAYIMCINCDLSVFNQMHLLAESFLKVKSNKKPQCLFSDDWQERVNLAMSQELSKKSWSYESLSIAQKKILAKHLFDTGAFAEKNAADYIAKILNLSRATIFNYLKNWRKP